MRADAERRIALRGGIGAHESAGAPGIQGIGQLPRLGVGQRALVADMLEQEFVTALRARGLSGIAIFRHIAKNTAPTVLAVAGLQIGYLMGGSILVETVFAWPGTGFLLNTAIFQRDIPLLQGTILVLCMFFVVLNLLVDILQPLIDPRMGRS